MTSQTGAPESAHRLHRSISWQQGMAIALGVPLLIVPSLGYMPLYVAGAAVLVWGLSVLQGFLQNLAYAELATTFPHASGLPGFAQQIFAAGEHGSRRWSSFVGGFSAWSYWFAWNPVMAIFALLIGDYAYRLLPGLHPIIDPQMLSICIAVPLYGILILVNNLGLKHGATLSYILGIGSLLPILCLAIFPLVTGHGKIENITGNFLPTDWAWDGHHLLLLCGIFAMAQWSACAWETAAIYAPEYRNPNRDVPKALFSVGLICLLIYLLVQGSVLAVLGVDSVAEDPVSPLVALAQRSFGPEAAAVVIILLIASLILIIQTAFLGSARAMHSMAQEANLPRFLAKTNKTGTPVAAMVVIALFNLALIGMGTPAAILAASAIGYTLANGISLFAYVKARKDPDIAAKERPFKAPANWIMVARACGMFNIPFCFIGVMYLNAYEIGWQATWVGIIVLASYIPLWWISHRKNDKRMRLANTG